MSEKYTEEQKTLIMLYGDLLGSPLSPAEKADFKRALAASEGDIEAAASILSPDESAKVRGLLTKGLKLSLELEKLGQRGIFVLFPEEGEGGLLKDFFASEPPILFAVGDRSLLDDEGAAVYWSLADFKAAGCGGIFLADRALDALLREGEVVDAVRLGRALLVSDLAKAPATIKHSPSAAAGRDGAGLADCGGAGLAGRPEKRVFISGSRSQRSIPKAAQDSLDAIIKQGIGILIGDSDKGVDSEIVDFLRVPLYERVTLYTIFSSPRVKPEPGWSVRSIKADASLKSQQRQMAKDRAMANDADWGMALFNPIEKNRYGALQVSSGTLRNTIQMLIQGKVVKFFYVFEGEMACRNLKKLDDLESLIAGYESERLSNSEVELILSAKGVSPDDDAAQVKSKKIMAKYRSLLKDEKKFAESRDGGAAPRQAAQSEQPTLPEQPERLGRTEGPVQSGKSARAGQSVQVERLKQPVQPSLFDLI